MELTTIERQLWDKFGETLWKSVQEQVNKMPDNADPRVSIMVIESSIDMFAEVYCKLPHPGISSERASEIILGLAYLMKKKFNEKIFG